MAMMGENWLPIPGYEGLYEISDQGRVRSLVNNCSNARTTPRMLKLSPRSRKSPYLAVVLHKRRKRRIHSLHVLVLEAFVSPRPAIGMHACHWDGNVLNCNLSNLRWGTPKENRADGVRNGGFLSMPKGSGHHNALLWDDAVRAIKAEPEYRGVGLMLARCFGVNQATISNIRLGVTWRHITDPLGAF